MVCSIVKAFYTFVALASYAFASSIAENASELLEQAVALVERGMENDDDIDMFEEADAIATRAVSLRPDDVDVQLGHGDILFALKEYDRAVSTFELAIKLDEKNFDAQFALGMTLGMRGKHSQAETSLRLATEITPSHAGAHQALGTTLGNLQRTRESEISLLRAIALEPEGDGEEQLRKSWKSGGRALPRNSGWEAARQYETRSIEAELLRDSLQALRAHEADSNWERRQLLTCANAAMNAQITCGHSVVFLEAWQAAWRLVEKLARRPHGKHVVLGGGLGAVCLFSLHLGNASECRSINTLCSFVVEAASLLNASAIPRKPSFSCGSLTSEENLAALRAADVVWLLDGEASKTMQADLEGHLASVLSEGAALVSFRMPSLGSQRIRPVGVQSVELFCIGSVNDKCINYRPVVSWEAERNLTTYILEVRTPASSSQQCAADAIACEEELCSEPLDATSTEERPNINVSALPHGSASHWCGKHPVLHIKDFISKAELDSLAPHLNAHSVNSSFKDLGRHPSECTHVWQNAAPYPQMAEDHNAIWERLIRRIDDVVGSPWGVVSINEARSVGSWGGCQTGLRNIHHDRNFYPQRFVTVILYLTDVAEGGHTIFPFFAKAGQELSPEQLALRETLKAHFLPGAISASPPQQLILSFRHATGFENEKAAIESFCDDATNYFAIRPVAGTAAIFWHEADDNFVWDSFHAGCPVKQGTKWTLQKFAERFQP